MTLNVYDIPSSVRAGRHSKAFGQFLHHWFVDSFGLQRHEVDLGFLEEMTAAEHELAVDLLRRNLHLGYAHIVEGIAYLNDRNSVPTLKTMLESTSDLSRKLTIAGTLWKLERDPVFPKLIDALIREGSSTIKQAHFDQVLWLDNEDVLRCLLELVNDSDSFVRFLALSRLNEFNDNRRYLVGEDQLPKSAAYFQKLKSDHLRRHEMIEKLSNYRPTQITIATTGGLVTEKIAN